MDSVGQVLEDELTGFRWEFDGVYAVKYAKYTHRKIHMEPKKSPDSNGKASSKPLGFWD